MLHNKDLMKSFNNSADKFISALIRLSIDADEYCEAIADDWDELDETGTMANKALIELAHNNDSAGSGGITNPDNMVQRLLCESALRLLHQRTE